MNRLLDRNQSPRRGESSTFETPPIEFHAQSKNPAAVALLMTSGSLYLPDPKMTGRTPFDSTTVINP